MLQMIFSLWYDPAVDVANKKVWLLWGALVRWIRWLNLQKPRGSQLFTAGDNDANASMGGAQGRSRSSKEDVAKVKQALNRLRGRDGTVKVSQLIEVVNDEGMNKQSAEEALEDLQQESVIVVADGEIFIV